MRQGGGGGRGRGFVGERAKDFKGTFKRLFLELKPFRMRLTIIIIFSLFSTLFTIVGPNISGSVTTEIYNGWLSTFTGGAGIDLVLISRTLINLMLLYCMSSVFSYMSNYFMSTVSQTISYNLREKMVAKINRMPMKYFDTKTHGEILSRVTNDTNSISMNLNMAMTQTINSVFTILGVLFMMLRINLVMTAAALVLIPFSALTIRQIVKISQKHYTQHQAYLGHLYGHIEEVYSGHIVVKAFNKEDEMENQFDELNETLYTSAWKSQFLSGLMQPFTTLISNISFAAVSILGGYFAVRNVIAVGQIQAFISYVRNFNMPINQSAQIVNMLQSTAAAAERVFEFLGEEEEVQFAENPAAAENIKGNVEFNNVCFSYDGKKNVINNFTADIKAGQKIAIVGHTGAGKTTLVKLLMRFYDIQSGEILIDGINIYDFDRSALRGLFGMVLQDTWLFNGTVMENIRYGRLDAADEEVIAAAKAAYANHFITTLQGGYKMELNEDATNISQGQKQLLTIARAILADPRILILDEATSSVDTRTEVLIQEAMDNLMKGRTSFIIAHRLSTIRNADRILVIDEGDIIEQGTHTELLERKGFYEQLYMSQFEHE